MSAHSLLRLFHILGGICWVGFAVFIAAFLLPAARAVGPASAPLMRELTAHRKLHVYMQAMSWLTLLSGVTLAWRDAGAMGVRWLTQGSGLVFVTGGAAAVLASIVGLAVSAPAAKRMGALSARVQSTGRAPAPEESAQLTALQDKLYAAARVAALLLLIAAAAMAFARYL